MPIPRPRSRFGTIVVPALLVAAMWATTPSVGSAFDLVRKPATYDNALDLFEGGNFHGAIAELKRFLKIEPENGPARLLIARALVRIGLGRSAEEQLHRAAALGIEADAMAVTRARSYILQGKFADMLAENPPGDRNADIDVKVTYLRSLAQYALGRFDDSDHGFTATLAHTPDHVGAMLGRIRIAIARLRLDEAASLVDEAAKRAPTTPDSWYLSGEIARRRGDDAAAISAYGKALANTANHVPARIARASLLVESGRLREAMADLDAVRVIAPSDPQSALLRSLISAMSGRTTEASSELGRLASTIDRRSKTQRNDGPSRNLLVGVVNHARGTTDQSLNGLRRYLLHAPQHVGARILIGKNLAERGDFAGAIATLRPALAFAPGDPALLGLLGGFHMRAGRLREAVPLLRAAIERDPGSRMLARLHVLSRLAAGGFTATQAELDDLLGVIGPIRGGALIGLMQIGGLAHADALDTARAIAERLPGSPFVQNLAGIVRLRQGEGERARQHFEQARALSSGYLPALFNLAAVATRSGNIDLARVRYGQVLTSLPDDATPMIRLSALAERAGDPESAVGWLIRAHELNKQHISVALGLGDLYLRTGRHGDALSLVTSVGGGRGRSSRLLEAVARTHVAAGDTALAIRRYRDVSNAETGNASDLIRIARIQRRLGDIRGAIYTFKTAMALDIGNHEARDGALELEAPSGGRGRELIYAEMLRHRYPNSGIGQVVAGNAWARDRHHGKAAAAYAQALRIEPRSETVLSQFRAIERAGKQPAALRLLDHWMEQHPNDNVVRRELAFATLRAGRLKRAWLLLGKLLAAIPRDAIVLNNLAWLSTKLGHDGALSFARRAFASRPADPAILDTYGMILVDEGKPERGLELLRRAQGQRSADPRLHYHVAVALNQLGRQDEARAELEAALRTNRAFAEANDARRLLLTLNGA